MMKKIAAKLLAVAMLLSLFPLGAINGITASAAIDGDFEYTVSNGKAAIISYKGSATDLVIPSTLGGYPVGSIGEEAFYDCASPTSITLPDGVTSIGNYAFSFCTSLTSITISSGVRSIGSEAFYGCLKLTSIMVDSQNTVYASVDGVLFNKSKTTLIEYPKGKNGAPYIIPDGVTSIGSYAFYNCEFLTSITIPSSVTSIGDWAFECCRNLETIALPDGLTKIGSNVFSNCDSLVSITIPGGVTSIGYYAFGDCNSLVNITLSDGVRGIGESAFKYCNSLVSITLPDSVTSIEESAFEGCTSLASITIPSGVTSIGYWAFFDCNALKTVCYKGTEEQGSRMTICSYNDNLTNASWGYNCVGAFEKDGLNYYLHKDRTATVALYAGTAKTLEIPIQVDGYTVTSIGEAAFYNCTSLKSITLPEGLTSIKTGAFSCCKYLTSIMIPDGVTNIGDVAFHSCTSLKSITLPDSVSKIGDGAFENDNNLKDVFYGGSKSDWKNIWFVDGSACFTNALIHYKANDNHWQMVSMIQAPTCVDDGEATYTCPCGYTANRAVSAIGHDLVVSKVVKPTCSAGGYTKYICRNCNGGYNDDYKTAAHNFESDVCIFCNKSVSTCLATSHNYQNNESVSRYVRQEGAQSITLTF